MNEQIGMMFDNHMRFEDDYLTRTYSYIINRPDLALTELVANAWDSGAENVKINISTLKDLINMTISVEDDGTGMSEDEFYERWMTLAYNRLKHQGEYAAIPDGRKHTNRRAYGRNGIGRHSLLCFSNCYTVETWKNGKANLFELEQCGGDTALKIKNKTTYSKEGHGTVVASRIEKNIPNIESIERILSARFMYDPQFKMYINGKLVELEDFKGIVADKEVKVFKDLKLKITALSSQRTARKSQQHGIAFWVNRRLVGEPSWLLYKTNIADGRTTIARQYTIIVQTDDMLHNVKSDWTGFIYSDRVQSVYNTVEEFANNLFKEVSKEKNDDLKKSIIRRHAEDIKKMDYSGKREIAELVDQIVDEQPELSKSYLDITVGKLVYINKSKNKKELLDKIFSLKEQDAAKLNKILDDWDISDMEFILDEIDRRIATLEAIQRFSSISGMDELHVLHPLVLEAKWLFGPEYDSSFYVSNVRLSTIMRKYLKHPELVDKLNIPRKRPDIIIFDDGSLIGYATEEHNQETKMFEVKKLLLIELKCGGKKITSAEINQTEEYMNELYYSNAFNSQISIDAYTVGESVSNKIGTKKDIKDTRDFIWGKIVATTYEQLVSTAEKRLFGLKEHLDKRYEAMGNIELLNRALNSSDEQTMLEYIKE